MLKMIFGVKRDEITGQYRMLQNAELYLLYSSPNIIRNLKSRRWRWAVQLSRKEESEIHTEFQLEGPRERYFYGARHADGRIILQRI